jgi:hypothetical protein
MAAFVSSLEEQLIKLIALSIGILHLGHVSKQYYPLFGRLPSETL